jgi:hypothetical protein
VTVIRADVDGDGRPDLILLYGRLSHQRIGDLYVPTSFVLKVVRARGGVVKTRIPAPEADPTILEVGHDSDEPGAQLFILVARISSGSSVEVYSLHAGRLTNAGPTLGVGGDSGAKSGFTCRAGSPTTIVQHGFVLERGGENGWWQRTDITYTWHDATLTQITRHTSMRRGLPPLSATGLGVGCGTITPTGYQQYPDAQGVRPTRRVTVPNPQQNPRAVFECVAGDLRLSLGPPISAQTGEHADVLVLRNESTRACFLSGYPTVTLSFRDKVLPFVYQRGGGQYVTASPPRTVVLKPRGRAYLLIAKYRCDGRVEHAANRVRIAIPALAGSLTLALNRPGAGQLNYCQRYPGDQRIDPGNHVTDSPIEPTLPALQ